MLRSFRKRLVERKGSAVRARVDTKLYIDTTLAAQVERQGRDPLRDITAWAGTKDFGKIISIDLDGVILQYEGWRGPTVFGPPVEGAADAIRVLRKLGWYVCIFTTRLVSESLIEHLRKYKIEYDDINGRVGFNNTGKYVRVQRYNRSFVNYKEHHRRWYWRHNPEYASIKPIASVYLDDMNFERGGKQYTQKDWDNVVDTLRRRWPT